MIKNKENLLKYSIALIFLLFGFLKFFPQLTPAESICSLTIQKLTFFLIPKAVCVFSLAILEVTIGLLLLSNKWLKLGIILAILHLIFTFSPFILLPSEVFDESINSFTLLGQYIVKNIIIICALLLIYPRKKEFSPIKIT